MLNHTNARKRSQTHRRRHGRSQPSRRSPSEDFADKLRTIDYSDYSCISDVSILFLFSCLLCLPACLPACLLRLRALGSSPCVHARTLRLARVQIFVFALSFVVVAFSFWLWRDLYFNRKTLYFPIYS